MPILKQILEWQVEHPNITWIGWGLVWSACSASSSGRSAKGARVT